MKFKIIQFITVIIVTTLVLTLSVSAIGKNHWAVDYVDFTYNTGILSDTRSGVGTSETITRGEMANGIAVIEGANTSNTSNIGFSDVTSSTAYAGAIKWASTQGIITGYTDGTFKPNDPIKRQDCALMLYRYFNYKNIDVSTTQTTLPYSDASNIQSYARTAVIAMHYAGVMTGYYDGTYRPRTNTLKTEAACFFTRTHAYRYNTPNSINIFVKGEAGLAINNAMAVAYKEGTTNSHGAGNILVGFTSNGFARFTGLTQGKRYAVDTFGYYTSVPTNDYLAQDRMYRFMTLPANQADYNLTASYDPSNKWQHIYDCFEQQWMFPEWCPSAIIEQGQNFGWRYNGLLEYHQGLDYACSYETITNTTGYDMTVMESKEVSSMGNYVRVYIEELDIYITYMHLSSRNVSIYESIAPGGTIGITGNTGGDYGLHLHVSVSTANSSYPVTITERNNFLDPRIYFK